MKTFSLPDLGEGLQDAEVVEWMVNVGDPVKIDQVIVVVETAKAIVELPSPVNGVVTAMHAAPGDTINVGEVMIEFTDVQELENSERAAQSTDAQQADNGENRNSSVESHREELASVSVVGKLKTANEHVTEETFTVGAKTSSDNAAFVSDTRYTNRDWKAPPDLIAFARHLGMEDRLSNESYGLISKSDIAKQYEALKGEASNESNDAKNPSFKLTGNKKVMAQTMMKSHQHVPAVTLFDDASIRHWEAGTDVTVRVLEAMIQACRDIPLLNAWFDEEALSIQTFDDINIGVAVNSNEGLFVPVIRQAQDLDCRMIRKVLDKMVSDVKRRSIRPQKLLGATISLSNFGTLSGRYATPIIVPPQVAIVGIGKIRDEPAVENGKIIVDRVLPISLSFDHRAATGGDASVFMTSMIRNLEK